MNLKPMANRFPFSMQFDGMDCGPSSLRMIAAYYGKIFSLEFLRSRTFIGRDGVNFLGISEAAEDIGFKTLAIKTSLEKLSDQAPLPCILHWNQNHFVVLHKVRKNKFFVADPARGLLTLKKDDFLKSWMGTSTEGIALLLVLTQSHFSYFYSSNKLFSHEPSNIKR